MCLLVFARAAHVRYRLVFAGNRDEFHARPAAPAHWWDDPAGLLAGKDLSAGGTWLGITRSGRFAVVTNFREIGDRRDDAPSRGRLVTDYAGMTTPASGYPGELSGQAERYAGFNLIFGDTETLHYLSNRGTGASPLPAGLHGLSNHRLDTPWPKLTRTRARFASLLDADEVEPEALFAMLADPRQADDKALPDTGIGVDKERLLSSPFIVSPEYGTRCSTVITVDHDGEINFLERSFDVAGAASGTVHFAFSLDA